MAEHGPEYRVDEIVDTARFAGLPLVVLACTLAVLALDGFDIQLIGFVAPVVTAEFGVSRAELGPVLGASLLGMAVGALALGPLGDRHGRRPALLASTLTFGLATLLGAHAGSIGELAFWRLVTGVGLGGALPNATALLAEYAAPKWRSQAITIAIVGVPLGGVLGSFIAADVISAFGWRALFVVGGALPLLLLPFLWRFCPESPRFLAADVSRRTQLIQTLARLTPERQYDGNARFVLSSTLATGQRRFSALFSPLLIRDTLGAWLAFATNIFAVYSFFSWSPVVLTSLGFSLQEAVRGSLYFNLAGIAGSVLNAWLIARIGSKLPLLLMCAIAGAALITLMFVSGSLQEGAAASTTSIQGIMWGIAAAGFSITAIQIGMYAVTAHIYPTECRSTGVGSALGVGRFGGIFSALAGGALLTQAGGAGFFGGIALAVVLTLVGVLIIRRHI